MLLIAHVMVLTLIWAIVLMLAYDSLIYVALNLFSLSVDIYLPHGTLINYLLLILSLIGIYPCTILFLFLWFMHAAGVYNRDDGP